MTPTSQIAHYRILSKLGEGGMGAVYRATDTKLNRDVAIKVLPPAFAEDDARMARFEREAQVLASLNHPNIASIYGIEAGALVMELVPGEDLRGPLPLDTALQYARQIAAGLEAAHEKGIIHRDLKPANIKVTPDGVVKLLDFGLAKATEPSAAGSSISPTMSPTLSLAMTQAGVILGTAAYMSPEQARGKPVDKRADVWAFGVVLYELITGSRPFQGEDVSQTMAAVIMQEPLFDAIPHGLRRMLRSCLEKDPKKRLRDIGDVWRLMEDNAPAPPAAPPPASRPAAAIAASVAAAVALAAAGALAFVHFRETPPAPAVTRFTVPVPGGRLNSVAISPDGRQIVESVNNSGNLHLTLRSLDTLEMRVLEGTEGGYFPFWSPDSRYIGFASGNKLRIADTHGGPPQTLADVSRLFGGGSWSPLGVILYSPDLKVFKQIPSGGGTAANVSAARPYVQGFPAFLPDGRHFLFASWGDSPESNGVYLGSLDPRDLENRQPRRLLPDVSKTALVPPLDSLSAAPDRGALLFVRESTLMGVSFDARGLRTMGDVFPIAERVAVGFTVTNRFSASLTGTLVYQQGDTTARSYTWYDRQGKVLGVVGDAGNYNSVSLSPDGTRLAGDRESAGNTDIWLLDLVRNSRTRLTFDPAPDTNPVWSPDGQWIAFNSRRSNGPAVYRKAANGTGVEELVVENQAGIHLYDWSRDSKYLLVAAIPTPGASRDLFAVPMEGQHKLIPLVQTPFRDDQGRFSPDGRFIAYKSNDTGVDQVYVQPFPPATKGERWLVSQDKGTEPRWSRDGKELYFVSGEGAIMVAPVQTSPTFRAGLPKLLFPTQMIHGGGNAFVTWDLTPDTKRFLVVNQQAVTDEPLMVVLNWQAGLRK